MVDIENVTLQLHQPYTLCQTVVDMENELAEVNLKLVECRVQLVTNKP